MAALALAIVCSAAGLAFSGCAGELPVPGQTSSPTNGASTTISTESQTVRLSAQVAATWDKAVQKLLPFLRGTPPAGTIQPRVADLKEQYVAKLVALGRQIRALPAGDQQSIYDRTMDLLTSRGGTDWFLSYKDLLDDDAALSDQASQDFAILLSSFNTLTEYAFFNVLKTDDPDEALRLGVE